MQAARATASSDKADFALCAAVRAFFLTRRGELLPMEQREAFEQLLTTFPYWVHLPGARPSELCFWTVSKPPALTLTLNLTWGGVWLVG
jgi:hypothetical protein